MLCDRHARSDQLPILLPRPGRDNFAELPPNDWWNFYKVERWSLDGLRVELMLYAGNSLAKARQIFNQTIKHRPGIRLTIRQRMRVVDEWPRHETIL
jgi:hypothetical protein